MFYKVRSRGRYQFKMAIKPVEEQPTNFSLQADEYLPPLCVDCEVKHRAGMHGWVMRARA